MHSPIHSSVDNRYIGLIKPILLWVRTYLVALGAIWAVLIGAFVCAASAGFLLLAILHMLSLLRG